MIIQIHEATRIIMKALNALTAAVPVSAKSDRERHHYDFKNALRTRYQCTDSSRPNVTKCMVLNFFFSTNDVIASHIVGLDDRRVCFSIGIEDVWNPRNGLLLHRAIDKKFEAMELVRYKSTDIILRSIECTTKRSFVICIDFRTI